MKKRDIILGCIMVLLALQSYSQVNILVYSKYEAPIERGRDSLGFSYIKLANMNKVYSLVISDSTTFRKVRKRLVKNSNTKILGGWGLDGKKLKFANPLDSLTRTKFRARLKRRIRRDSIGDVIEDREYTDEEINGGIINEIFGWGKRDHED